MAASRCLLAQSEVDSIIVIVEDVVGKQTPQMLLVQNNDVVEQFAAAAANPAVRHSILPGTPHRRSHSRDVHRANCGGHFESVLRIVIKYEERGNSIVFPVQHRSVEKRLLHIGVENIAFPLFAKGLTVGRRRKLSIRRTHRVSVNGERPLLCRSRRDLRLGLLLSAQRDCRNRKQN